MIMYTNKHAELIDTILEAIFMVGLIAFGVAYTIFALS